MKEYTKLNDIISDLNNRQRRIECAKHKNWEIRQHFDINCENCKREGGCQSVCPLCFRPNKEWMEKHEELEEK